MKIAFYLIIFLFYLSIVVTDSVCINSCTDTNYNASCICQNNTFETICLNRETLCHSTNPGTTVQIPDIIYFQQGTLKTSVSMSFLEDLYLLNMSLYISSPITIDVSGCIIITYSNITIDLSRVTPNFEQKLVVFNSTKGCVNLVSNRVTLLNVPSCTATWNQDYHSLYVSISPEASCNKPFSLTWWEILLIVIGSILVCLCCVCGGKKIVGGGDSNFIAG